MSQTTDNKILEEIQTDVTEKLTSPPVLSAAEATEALKKRYNDTDITVWKINGFEFELDMSDYDTTIKYFAAAELIDVKRQQITATMQNNMRTPEVIKHLCDLYYTFIDALFGDGTSMKIFDGKYNIRKAMAAHDELIDMVNRQAANTIEITNLHSLKRQAQSAKFNPDRVKKNKRK